MGQQLLLLCPDSETGISCLSPLLHANASHRKRGSDLRRGFLHRLENENFHKIVDEKIPREHFHYPILEAVAQIVFEIPGSLFCELPFERITVVVFDEETDLSPNSL